MLQKEVVERMAAAPGSKDYGRLTVMLQWRYDDRIGARRAAGGVRSAAAGRLGGRAHAAAAAQPAADIDAARLGELVTVAFSQRRKLLRHTLGRWLDAAAASSRPFDLQRRAEEVPVAEYLALARGDRRLSDRRDAGRAASDRGRSRARRSRRPPSGGVEPHRGVEGAAHHRHVHAEAAFAAVLGTGLDRLCCNTLGHLRRPLP